MTKQEFEKFMNELKTLILEHPIVADWYAEISQRNGTADTLQTDIPKSTLRTDCTGCRFVGSYDTEFPCANCSRKTKDYYSAEQTERSE